MKLSDLKIKCFTEFKVAVMGEMGGWFHKIELKEGNWRDILREAVDFFRMADSGSATRRTYYKFDLDREILEYNVENLNIVQIVKIMGCDSTFYNAFLHNMMLNGVGSVGSWINLGQSNLTSDYLINLNDYQLNYANMRTVEKFFKIPILFDYNMNNNILTLKNHTKAGHIKVMLDCIVLDELDDLFNNYLFRKYCTALAKRTWATNLEGKIKIDFPHGEMTIDQVKADAMEEIEKYEAAIRSYGNHGLFKRT